MYTSDLFVKAEMDYRSEKARRGTPVPRRNRNRKRLVRRQTPEITTTN